MQKFDLDQAILDIVNKLKIKNQSQFVKSLKQKGIEVDQSTLSRHLRSLGVQKNEGYYFLPGKSDDKRGRNRIQSIPPNLILIKTLPGFAQAFAVQLDKLKLAGIAGTVAGDDTVLCVIEHPRFLGRLVERLEMMSPDTE